MICLDTNYLIRGLIAGTAEAGQLINWIEAGESLVTPALAWLEFLCGPVTPSQVSTMRAFLSTVVAFDEPQALEAARLFNAVGRNRRLRVAAMIAGTAVSIHSSLATSNRADFEPFRAHGLQLRE